MFADALNLSGPGGAGNAAGALPACLRYSAGWLLMMMRLPILPVSSATVM